MLITHQKFRLCMIGHYNSSCHIDMHNMHKMWGLLYLHAIRTLPTSCHVLLHMQGHHVRITWHAHAGKPATLRIYVACQKLLKDMLFMPVKQYLSKLTASHFGTLNMRITNQNMLKRIIIAMHNGNKADCNENFRIGAEEAVALLYKW